MPIKRLNTSSGNDELISHIKDSLANHEESYAPGAWENFNKKEERGRGLIFWIGGLSSAAALLLIGFGLFYNSNLEPKVSIVDNTVRNKPSKSIEQKQIDASTPLQPQVTPPGNTGIANIQNTEEFTAASPEKDSPVNNKTGQMEQLAGKTIPSIFKDSTAPSAEKLTALPTGSSIIEKAPLNAVNTVATEPVKKPVSLDEFLAKETELNKNSTSKTTKDVAPNKWDVGVVVAPSFGNTNKLNMGYGLSMAYNLNNKLSIGSGLSYNEMGATKDAPQEDAYSAAPSNALLSDTKSLQSMNAKLVGLDIPLELRYNLSSRFYANVGVSAFAVINQQQNNVYLQGTVVQRTAVNPAGDQQTQSFFVTEKVTEKAPEAVSQTNKLLGFYNFSFGYKQKISKDKSLGIEPFLKVPMKEVTKENLYLMGTGLKIKFNF